MTALEAIDEMILPETGRTKRQLLGGRKWILAGGEGTIEWPTGVGKTNIALSLIEVMRRDEKDRTVLATVPTIQLKTQWEEVLTARGLHHNAAVEVINSLVKRKTPLKVDMLILDEIHRYAAKTFSKVFGVVDYEFILGLTATLKRLDKKHKILEVYCPIVDSMSLWEARKNHYLAEFREYNLGIEMTDEEREVYRDLASKEGYGLDKFHRDFELMMKCSIFGINPSRKENPVDGRTYYLDPLVVQHSRTLGWNGNTAYEAWQVMESNKTAPRGQKRSLWGRDDHPYHPRKLYIAAINGMRANRQMKAFITNSPGKRVVVTELLKLIRLKTIVFGESIEQAELIKEEVGRRAVLYHSKMTAKEKREAMKKLMGNNTTEIVLTARSLDQGFDWPSCQLGITDSRTSSTTQHTQRLGRVVRLFVMEDGTEKTGIFINVYIKDTKDYKWLIKSLGPNSLVIWVDDIESILQSEGLISNDVLNDDARPGTSTEVLHKEPDDD